MRALVGPLAIQIESCGNRHSDAVQHIDGAHWDGKTTMWRFPATPHAAKKLLESSYLTFDDESRWALQAILDPPAGADYKAHEHLPPDFRLKLWTHQAAAVDFAWWRPATMLAMEMRTGKTAVSIALASLWGSKRILVSCPLSVVRIWPAEARSYSAQPWVTAALDSGSVVRKTERVKDAVAAATRLKRPLLVVVNHESVWRNPFADFILDQEWDLLIVDESQRAKAPGGKLSRFLGHLADHIPRRLALSGTPLPHDILDAYGQYRFLDRSIFGTSYNRMKNRFAITSNYNKHHIVGFRNTDLFSSKFHEIAFEATTAESFDLPPEMDVVRIAAFEKPAQKIYDSLLSNFWAEVESGQVTASNALSKLLRLQQVTSGHVKKDDGEMALVSSAKANLLRDFLEDVPIKEPLVVFVRFVLDIERVREICESQGRTVGEVSGRKKELTDEGRFPEDVDVMVVQIQSGSLGINLSRASTAIFYSWGWSLGDILQARARIRHAEQTRSLQFVHLVIADSIDERMRACLQDRKDFIEDILETGREAKYGSEHQSSEKIRSEAEQEGRVGAAAQGS
jgi:SNF2 family DNA or RNA helicase